MSSLIAEVMSYPVTFKVVPKLRVATALDLIPSDAADKEEDVLVTLKPSKSSRKVKVYDGTPMTVFVDGGYGGGIGVAGFVVDAPKGGEVVQVGKFDVGYSNNQSELLAVKYALEFIV